jgi:prepilin-type N-terminal cleavage/methylation domain-containing protein
MLRRRGGFTLIELLIVIVIIGILASIAIPKLGKTRERAYFRAMMSDLRHLHTRQEIYFNRPNTFTYTTDETQLDEYKVSSGVTLTISEGTSAGFVATASHAGLDPTQTCGIFYGTVSARPAFLATPGMVICTGE